MIGNKLNSSTDGLLPGPYGKILKTKAPERRKGLLASSSLWQKSNSSKSFRGLLPLCPWTRAEHNDFITQDTLSFFSQLLHNPKYPV